MTEILLFHHVLGLTPGVVAFADELRAAGHVVHTPDLWQGKIFSTVDEGAAHEESIGFEPMIERTQQIADDLPNDIVYGGFSMGVVYAQRLATIRPGAKGALFFYSAVPTRFFGSWPELVPLQIHMMDADPFALPPNEDLEVARQLAETIDGAELFLYPGDRHLFADNSTPDYDDAAATLAKQRALEFLAKVE